MVQNLEVQCRWEPDIALILLPELSTIEYSSASFDNLADLAEPLEGETFAMLSSLAKRVGCVISYGYPQVEDGTYLISQAVVGSSGQLLTTYSKLHLAHFGASMEQDYFSCGDTLSVFEFGGFRFGTIICYDFRFSELIKGVFHFSKKLGRQRQSAVVTLRISKRLSVIDNFRFRLANRWQMRSRCPIKNIGWPVTIV